MYKLIFRVFSKIKNFLVVKKNHANTPKSSVQTPIVKAILQEVPIGEESWMKGLVLTEIQRFTQTQRSTHTRRAYEGDLRQFLSYIRAENLNPSSIDTMLAYRDWLVLESEKGGAGLSNSSANRKITTVRAFMTWLQQRGYLRENAALWVKNFRAKKESPTQGFSDIEVAKILTLPSKKSRSGRMHLVILNFLFYLGLRRGEIVALKANHLGRSVHSGREYFTIRVPGKGDKERILPLPDHVLVALRAYMDREGIQWGIDRYLFQPVRNNITKKMDKPLHTHAIYYIVQKYAKIAGVETRVSPHSCRATCISNALDRSASHRAVQQMAGWSSPLMIERYDKRRTELHQSAVHTVHY